MFIALDGEGNGIAKADGVANFWFLKDNVPEQLKSPSRPLFPDHGGDSFEAHSINGLWLELPRATF